ncbi:MAG: discoidin domain-containing protein, partial [bacterium]|nr:discoidin domain-containing protein [bacterium]
MILVVLACCMPAFSDVKSQYIKSLEKSWIDSLESKPAIAGRRQQAISPKQDAYGAVNGTRYERTGFHTRGEKLAWWQVDLQKSYRIGTIVVANREECQERANRLEILLSQDGKKWKKVYTHNGTKFDGGTKNTKPLTVKLGNPSARYVRLQVRNTFLHLNEVEVYPRGKEK